MRAIAAVSENWGLGKDNDLLFHISADMKRFRALTSGGTVIMGRKTLDSMPGGKALPKRRNIVITRDTDFSRENVEVAHSVEEAVAMVAGEEADKVWVIGGGEIYKAMLPYCSMCCITHVHGTPECDVFFPDLSALENWKVQTEGELQTEDGIAFRFVDYCNE